MAFALIPTSSPRSLTATPAASFEAVLQEFADVFPQELPEGLPPLRDL